MNAHRFSRVARWGLISLGVYLLISSGYMQLKAELAQFLISTSWSQRESNEMPSNPWPWADTRAVAILEIPAMDIKQYVMQDASGESLAFGPGLMTQRQLPASGGHSLIAGHRDSHFDFLEKMPVGTQLQLSNFRGESARYQVVRQGVIDSRYQSLALHLDKSALTLVTCYPFNAVDPRGSLRWVVDAIAI